VNKTSEIEFQSWLKNSEGLNLEFKKAENSFNESKDLPDYCSAIANEGGGKLILGVSDNKTITGSKAFKNTYHTVPNKILQSIGIRVDIEECYFSNKRVLIFHIPSRPSGIIIASTGNYKYPMRVGSSLMEMNSEKIKEIVTETIPDFSSTIVEGFNISDVDIEAISIFSALWAQKQNKPEYKNYPIDKTLKAIGAMTDKGLNYACLILFGKKERIDELLPGAEIIFEWRQEKKIRYDSRINWREPFFKIFDNIWGAINARNIRIPFHEGFIQREIFSFTEEPVREAVLNAVTHRDYRINSASIFIKASPEEIVINSPGGFLPGITQSNILEKSEWRNRRIAEIFEKAGLVERSGQGMEIIFGSTIKEGKGLPGFSGSDQYAVQLTIPAVIKDENFILYIEKIGNEKQISLSFEEILELENIREKRKLHNPIFKNKFLDLGIIERIGNTSGSKYVLSHKYYAFKGKPGLYTRIVGISRDEKKHLIVKHIQKNKKGFARDFVDIFPDLTQKDISNLLQELKKEGKISHEGTDKSGCWVLLN